MVRLESVNDPLGPSPGAISSRYQFIRRFIKLNSPYLFLARNWKVRTFAFALFFLTLAQVGLAIWTNYWSRELFDTLEQRSMKAFLMQIGTFVVIFVLTMVVTAIHLRVKRWLQLDWRKWLTETLLDKWMSNGQHYQLTFYSGEHDNPDGRIAEDIRIATELAIALAHTLVYSIFILASFIDILLSVSGTAKVAGTSVEVPGYMVLLAFAYAGVGTALGVVLGRSLIKSTNELQTAEANFRFGLAHARENSEAIALMRGERVERRLSARLFSEIRRFWNKQSKAFTGILFFTSGYGALLPVFPILIAAPQYIAGTMTLGVLMQAAQAFQKLTSALSWPIDNLSDMARCRASAERLLSLYENLDSIKQQSNESEAHRIKMGFSTSVELRINDLSIANPDGQIIVEGLNLCVQRGERILISGDPSATLNLFKIAAGLWPWGRGEVLLPQGQGIFFMPQRPFLPDGRLRAALSYPADSETFDSRGMHYALECAGLAFLAQRLDDSDQWDRVLTLRVQQRLGFARLLLYQPSWIFIEEATDAFDPTGEVRMMEMLCREFPNATIITISFHTALERYHHRKVVLTRIKEKKYLFDTAPFCLLKDKPVEDS